MLVSPAEPAVLRDLGRVSSRCESLGADFLILSPLGQIGVQRKAWRDLISSVQGRKGGDRLYREVHQLRGGVDIACLVIEGRPKWTADGELADEFTTFTQGQWWGLIYSLCLDGLWVVQTKDQRETVFVLRHLERWARKGKHTSLRTRPGPKGAAWGKVTSRDFRAHLWQSFQDIGEDTAYNLADAFERVPMRLTVGDKELLGVKGMGKKRLGYVKELIEA